MLRTQQHTGSFEHAKESVMRRTIDGTIKSWDRNAEDLYGWEKDEVLGRVSHDLLKSQFPKPLAEIESDLMEKGQWEGQLLHVRRDGTPVVVKSRWSLDSTEQPGMVIEVNTRCNSALVSHSPERTKLRTWLVKCEQAVQCMRKLANVVLAGGVFLLVVAVISYGHFGYDLVEAVYDGKIPGIGEWILQGKSTTPLTDYYVAADQALVKLVLSLLVFVPLIVILFKNPIGALLMGFSVFAFSLLLFSLLEVFPSLIIPLKLDSVSTYYSYKAYYMPHDQLGWKKKPFTHIQTSNFRQAHYSPLYGIEVPPMRLDWLNDENGFRNSSVRSSYDVVVVGDSYMDFGESESDTFPKRLEKHLDGLTVLNLGIAGYGPFQYLEVLKKYGLPKNPKYALFSFYSGNDIGDIREFLLWRQGSGEAMYTSGDVPFWQGYIFMLNDLRRKFRTVAATAGKLFFDYVGVTGGYPYIYPEIAVLDLGPNGQHKIKFVDLNETASPQEISRWDEWRHLAKILTEFKELCLRHGIKPVAVHVPSATAIYADQTTLESGTKWRRVRDRQVAAKNNIEIAFVHLAEELDIELINLSPVLKNAAERGHMVYYSLDSHWNSDGRELAARHVAAQLRQMNLSTNRIDSTRRVARPN
jgi:PAS domain S-box-containing protein